MGKPTMDDVAEKAGVSRALVSLVMRDSPRVSDHSREKVQLAAAELGYRPNQSARNLASGQTNTIGVMLNDLHNPYFTEMTEGAAEEADSHGLQLLINSGWQRPGGEIPAIESFLSHRTDGLLLGSPRLSPDVLEEYATQVPVVSVSHYSRPSAFDTVSNDEAKGAALIVDHLVDLGHSRIAHIDAGDGAGGRERRGAFSAAMMAHGIAPIIVEGDYNEAGGYEGARNLMELRDPPTALFAANDLAAVGALSYLREQEIDVPGQVSVVGYDNTILAHVGTSALTTVHQPRQEIGRRAMQLLVERIAGRKEAKHELVEPSLIIRSSTGRAPS